MTITYDEFEEQVGELIIRYLAGCTSEEIHQLVLAWNFDNSKKPIQWIADSPKTDRGTALMLFWLMEPDFAYQFETKAEMKANEPWYEEDWDIIETLEKNYMSDFYKNQEFGYTPKPYFLDDSMKRAIPDELFVPLKGSQPTEPTGWEEGIPPKLQAKYDGLCELLEEE
jgi:hypothetical protein